MTVDLDLPVPGEDLDDWGSKVNAALTALQDAINGVVPPPAPGSITIVDNGDGSETITGVTIVDDGDGSETITGATIVDDGDGSETIS